MRVLFASTAGAGHLNPLKPWIRACLDRGDDVLVVVPPGAADNAASTGVPVRVGAAPDEETSRRLWGQLMQLPAEEANGFLGREIFGGINTEAMVPAVTAAVEEFKPDLVVREPMEYAAAVAGPQAGVPVVRVGIVQAVVDARYDHWGTQRSEERAPGTAARIAASPYLTRFPASLDPDHYPDTRRYRQEAGVGGSLPDWWDGADGPLVYVTFGTEAPRQGAAVTMFETALAAVAGLPARVLLTTGRDFDVTSLGDVPDNVHVEPWADHATVLPAADVVLHHGGSGSTLDCLAAGVPQVVLPLFADQPDNAAMVADAGLGVSLSSAANDAPMRHLSLDEAPTIRKGVERALDGDFRPRAREVQREMAGLPALEQVLQSLV